MIVTPVPLEGGMHLPADGLSFDEAERIAAMVRAWVVRDKPRERP